MVRPAAREADGRLPADAPSIAAPGPQRRRLSSRGTSVYKVAFPALWVGFGVLGLAALRSGPADGIGVALGAIWLAVCVFLLWLAAVLKHVVVDGDMLEISGSRETLRLPLRDVERVSGTVLLNPELVFVSFRRPTPFGTRIAFIPMSRGFHLLSRHPVVARLQALIDQHQAPGLPPPLEQEPRSHAAHRSIAFGVLVLGVAVALIAGLLTTVLQSAAPYWLALERAISHPALVAELGEPIRPGWRVSGRVEVADEKGSADLAIPLSGPRGEATLRARATRSGGEWTFQELHATLEDGRRVDLLGDAAEPQGELL